MLKKRENNLVFLFMGYTMCAPVSSAPASLHIKLTVLFHSRKRLSKDCPINGFSSLLEYRKEREVNLNNGSTRNTRTNREHQQSLLIRDHVTYQQILYYYMLGDTTQIFPLYVHIL